MSDLKHPMDAKTSLEDAKIKDSQIMVSRQFNLLENPIMVFCREENFNL